MNLRSIRTAAPLAAVTGNGGEVFFQNRQHLSEIRHLLPVSAVPAESRIRLFHGTDSNQGAGDRIGQHAVYQDFRGKEIRKDSGCIYLVDQQAFLPESRLLPDSVQHPALQQITAALKHIHPGIPCAPEEDVVIVGCQSGKANPPLLLQLDEGIHGPSLPEDFLLMLPVRLMDKVDVRPGSQVFTGFQDCHVHFISVKKTCLVRDDDSVPFAAGRKQSCFPLRISVFRDNGCIIQVAAQAKGMLHHCQRLLFTEIITGRKNRYTAFQDRNRAKADFGNHQPGASQFTISHSFLLFQFRIYPARYPGMAENFRPQRKCVRKSSGVPGGADAVLNLPLTFLSRTILSRRAVTLKSKVSTARSCAPATLPFVFS